MLYIINLLDKLSNKLIIWIITLYYLHLKKVSGEVLYVSIEGCFMHIVRVLVIPAFIFAIVLSFFL